MRFPALQCSIKFLFCVFVCFCATASSFEGIEYQYLELANSSYLSLITDVQSIHMIEVDPTVYEIRPVKALDNGIGRESVLSLSKRYGAIAAINGGFFKIGGTFEGKAAGALKIHTWYALPHKPRACIGWSSEVSLPKMDRLLVSIQMHHHSISYDIDGLNSPRKQGEMVLFTPQFHKTTLTDSHGEELLIINGTIASIQSGGSTKIPENGYILSIHKSHPLFGTFSVGMPLNFSTNIKPLLGFTSSRDWKSCEYIVGGVPLLLYEGQKIDNFEEEQTIPTFLTKRHARTAIGILPNDHWLFVVVDKKGYFDGMTMEELVNFMETRGCIAAINLDGGGSSTMVYKENVINSPHGDEDEGSGQKMLRRVSDAILILPKK